MSYQTYAPPPSPGYGSVYPPPPPQPQGYHPSAPPPPSSPGHPSPQYTGGYPYQDPSGPVRYSYQPPRPGGYYQGYFGQDYPPPPLQPQPQPQPQPYQVYHCENDHHDNDYSSFLRGCLSALCFCCVLEEFCGLA